MNSSCNAAADSSPQETARETVPPVALSATELRVVTEILRRHVRGRAVWAYGSRARGTRLKKYSDLDLAIEGPAPGLALSQLAEAFDESPLPFKVDIVEVNSLEPELLKRIEADKVILLSAE